MGRTKKSAKVSSKSSKVSSSGNDVGTTSASLRPRRGAQTPARHKDMVPIDSTSSAEERIDTNQSSLNGTIDDDLNRIRSQLAQKSSSAAPASDGMDLAETSTQEMNNSGNEAHNNQPEIESGAVDVTADRQLAMILQGDELRKSSDARCSLEEGRADERNSQFNSRVANVDETVNVRQLLVEHRSGDEETGMTDFLDASSHHENGPHHPAINTERNDNARRVDASRALVRTVNAGDAAVIHENTEITALRKDIKNLEKFIGRNFVQWNGRLDKLEAQLEQLDGPEFPLKPDCLPLRKLSDLERFENISKDEHKDVIFYLSRLGGMNAHECANLMLKESLHDRLAPKVNYYGKHEGTRALDKTKFMKVLYKAMAKNRNLRDLTLEDFSAAIIAGLRAAKQRRRNVLKKRHDEAPTE